MEKIPHTYYREYNMKRIKKITACFLIVALTLCSFSLNIQAKGYKPADNSVTITADMDEPYTIKSNPDNIYGDILSVYVQNHDIERDYEQKIMLTVENNSDDVQEFYFEADNEAYKDLSYEIIKEGSKATPAIINPDEEKDIELSVFAQNAEEDTYKIPVKGYTHVNDDWVQDIDSTVTVTCKLPVLDLTWKKKADDSSTLAQTYRITNNGDELQDLAVSAEGDLENNVVFTPILTNYVLTKGQSVEFTVQPDLMKMKEENLKTLSGALVASCAGKRSKQDCTFDTRGKDITVTTMGKLSLKQDGNPYTNFEIVEDSVIVQHLENGEYVDIKNPSDPSNIMTEDGNINFKQKAKLDLGTEKKADFDITVKTSDAADTNTYEEPVFSHMLTNGTLQMTVKATVSAEKYKEMLSNLSMQPLSVYNKRTLAKSNEEEFGPKKTFEMTLSINDYFETAFEEDVIISWRKTHTLACGMKATSSHKNGS